MHRKGLVIGILILMLGVNIGSTFAGDADVKNMSTVSFDGNTLYVGGSGANNYTTIQSAIDNASDGDTVFVYDDSSPYYENVVVDKSIDLIGENKFSTILNGTDITGFTIEIIADNVTIFNFTISDFPSAEIYIRSSHCHINNNIMKAIHPDITCTSNSNYNNISKNELNDNGCIYLSSSDNNIISENKILHSSESAISLINSANNIISGNELSNGLGGILLQTDPGFDNDVCMNNTIINNNLDSFEWRAIRINSCKNIYVQENNISSSNIGIGLYESTNCKLYRNMFFRNLNMGLVISLFSSKNEICNNNFIKNNENANFGVFSFKNTWDGNYWDKPRNFPYLIIGRLFLFIPWINIDWNPAQEPYDIDV